MQTQEALLYLTACGIQNKAPDKAKLAGTDMQALLQVSRFHSLSALVCTALEASGAAMPDDFRQDKAKAIRKNLLLDAERSRICSFLEEHGIWYMPLKGSSSRNCTPVSVCGRWQIMTFSSMRHFSGRCLPSCKPPVTPLKALENAIMTPT